MPRVAMYRGQPLLANHQKSWLWGTVPVWETLRTGRWPIYELVLSENASQPAHQECLKLAEQQQIPARREPAARLEQLCKARDHQGILALMGPFPYTDFAELLHPESTAAAPTASAPTVVVLDRVQDPHNLGAIVRSAAAFGISGLVLGRESQVGVTSHVARSSAGTVNFLRICQVDHVSEALQALQTAGYHILATGMEGTLSVRNVRQQPAYRDTPLAVVIGNEGSGMNPELLPLCEAILSIPMTGSVESLNAAVAAGIVLFELTQPV